MIFIPLGPGFSSMSPDNSSKYKKTVASMKEHIFNNYNEFDNGIAVEWISYTYLHVANSRIRVI